MPVYCVIYEESKSINVYVEAKDGQAAEDAVMEAAQSGVFEQSVEWDIEENSDWMESEDEADYRVNEDGELVPVGDEEESDE